MVEQKKALKRLQLKLVELIRDLESTGVRSQLPMNIETTNWSYQLDFKKGGKKRDQFRLIKFEEEEA